MTRSRLASSLAALGFVFWGAVNAAGHMNAQESRPYGVFSNMQAFDGDYSGFEFIVLPSNEGDFLLFQAAEGWPSKPILFSLSRATEPTAGTAAIVFDHPEMGPFKGTVAGDSLIGEFTRMKYPIRLRRGPSIWQ